MQRDTAVAIVLALLALLAIGAAGATLENPAATDSGSGIGSGSGDGIGSGSGGSEGAANGSSAANSSASRWTGEISGACIAVLQTLSAKLLLAGTVAALSGYVWWRTGSRAMALAAAVLYGPIVYMFWFALGSCGTLQQASTASEPANATQTTNGTSGGGGSLGAAAETATSQPSVLLVVVLVVLVLAAIVLLYVASADDIVNSQIDREGDEEETVEPDIAAVGRLAGEAADRIETGDAFDNEVFRAWVEMTHHLAVDHPESSTPAEFAAAAVDAGMSPDDVRELTDLFEEVRYGDHEVTEEREQRATAALRRIESSYAEEADE
ncbi:DUF4129 domain-containing protein [Halolamina sp. CBA1230]|uniref:DUF4129 domain-containing protein n=1 Tax=Halolamina sp. CBA1230 TaxID=1853690 RepID=UPI0009A19897|nr:DUF4129 domain-containing protein [Halolamina sp. CBA1230]QKY20852.1 DUF4129 domain-containing protein [Halolamina sp. CBA1230]